MVECIAYNMKVVGLIQLAKNATLKLQLFHQTQAQVQRTKNSCGTVENMKRHTQLLLGMKSSHINS